MIEFGSQGYEPLSIDQVNKPPVRTAAGVGLDGASTNNQFMIYKLGRADQPVIDLTKVEPTVKGTAKTPDAAVRVRLSAFHFDERIAEDSDPNDRATLRFDLGKDSASESRLSAAFWSIAAGVDLFADFQSGANKKEPKKLSQNFDDAFAGRPVEIPGGLGQLRLEVIRHREPAWWRKLIHFGSSDTTRKLITAFGFPGIAVDAVKLVDEMMSRFDQAGAEPVISTRPLTIAFTEQARKAYTGDGAGAVVGSIGDGAYVLLRQSDTRLFRDVPPLFNGLTGSLVPRKEYEADPEGFDANSNPYRNITYGVINVATAARQISF